MLIDLATHTSGLPFNPDNFVNPKSETYFAGYSADRLYAFLSGCTLKTDPGKTYSYSNLGMGLLGHAVERKAGAKYESLLIDRICTPLKMDSTRITLSPALQARLLPGHGEGGKPSKNFDDLGVLVGAGAIRSSANDMLKYVAANMGLPPVALTPTMAKTHAVRYHDSVSYAGTYHGDTAMAWMDDSQSQVYGTPLTSHAGGTNAFSSFIGFDKVHRRGVVVLVNQSGAPQRPATLGWVLLQRLALSKGSCGVVEARCWRYVGIGVALDEDKSAHTVHIRMVLPGTSAERAGLKAGQVVQRIGDRSAAGLTTDECAKLIRGPAGTTVRITLVDKDQKVTDVELTRQKIQ
jgi:CubicO group peptidase (beta-lactamase class C family)